MRLPRAPYPRLILWTAFAVLPMPWLIGVMTAPISPGCFEYCGLGRDFAAFGLLLVGMLWLLVVLVVAWSWREREPTVAAVSAVLASAFLLIVAARFFDIVSYDVLTDDLLQLVWVLSFGLQLPPVWRLARRTSPSAPLRIVVGATNAAVGVAAFALVFLGTSVVWSVGPSVVSAAWVVLVSCLILVTAAAWRDGVAELSLVGPLLCASLLILLVPVGIAAPGDIGYVISLALPLSAVAWLWIAVAWLLGRGAPTPIDRAHASAGNAD